MLSTTVFAVAIAVAMGSHLIKYSVQGSNVFLFQVVECWAALGVHLHNTVQQETPL